MKKDRCAHLTHGKKPAYTRVVLAIFNGQFGAETTELCELCAVSDAAFALACA